MRIVPTVFLVVPYTKDQTPEQAEENRRAVAWAQYALAQMGICSIAPVPVSVHFQALDGSAPLPADEFAEWCREAARQQIRSHAVHGVVVLGTDERCTDSELEVSEAIRQDKPPYVATCENGIWQLPDELMEWHSNQIEWFESMC